MITGVDSQSFVGKTGSRWRVGAIRERSTPGGTDLVRATRARYVGFVVIVVPEPPVQ